MFLYQIIFLFKVRFALKFISGAKKLPSKSEMLSDEQTQTRIHLNKGYSKRRTHFLGPEQHYYFEQLSKAAEIENAPDVISAIFVDSQITMAHTPSQFRNYRYIIIDDKTFKKEKCEN